MILAGAGAANTILQACTVHQKTTPCPAGEGAVDRVFDIQNLARVTISDVTIRHGRGDQIGGGIVVRRLDSFLVEPGWLFTLTNVIVTDNFAVLRGGGLFDIGALNATNVTFVNNTALGGDGGGMLVAGGLMLTASRVAFNVARSGGGISNVSNPGTVIATTVDNNIATHFTGGGITSESVLTLLNSTVSNNQSAGTGGGFNGSQGVFTNSTVSGNSGDFCGGVALSSAATLNNVTITQNTANSGDGGGLCGNLAVTLRNTVIAGNRDLNTATVVPDCLASGLSSQGFNLIGDATGCGGALVDGVNGDQVGSATGPIDARLGPLADNGGPTFTNLPLGGSPVLDRGNPAGCTDAQGNELATDQRGVPRSVDANSDGSIRCDVGAVESLGVVGTFTLSGIRPRRGGNTGSATALLYGSGFVSGSTVKLSRPGEAAIPGEAVTVNVGGAVAAAIFNLAGRSPGPWDVVVTNPDATSVTLAAGFQIEEGGAPELWADTLGPPRVRVGRPARYTVLFGNRGTVDAFAVPLGISVPKNATLLLNFPVTPPPPRPGQVPTEWQTVPVTANTGPQSNVASMTLLLPVVPAGFTGMLEFTLTLNQAGPYEVTFGAGGPYFQPDLNPRVVSAFLIGAQSYAQRSFGTSSFPPSLVLEEYIREQLQNVVAQGFNSLLANFGSQSQVYSVGHLMIDLARYAAVQPE